MKIKVDSIKHVFITLIVGLLVYVFVTVAASKTTYASVGNLNCNASSASFNSTNWVCTSGANTWNYLYAWVWHCPYASSLGCCDSTGGCGGGAAGAYAAVANQYIGYMGQYNTNYYYTSGGLGSFETYGGGYSNSCGCVQHDIGANTSNGNGTAGGIIRCNSACCRNTCTYRGVDGIGATYPANGTIIRNTSTYTSITFQWNFGGNWGECGGDSCSVGCYHPTGQGFIIYIEGLNVSFNPVTQYIYNTGQRSFNPGLTFGVGKYRWRVTTTALCSGQSDSGWQYFTINRAPTASGTILSHALCLTSATSKGYSGIHAGRIEKSVYGDGSSGINNPVLVTTSYTDADGISDLSLLQVEMKNGSNGAVGGTNNDGLLGNSAYGALGTVRFNGGSYYLADSYGNILQYLNPYALASNTIGVCTQGGWQYACDTSATSIAANTSITAYAKPTAISSTNNTINVDWEIGLLNAGVFNGQQSFDVKATDNQGMPGYVVDATPWLYGLIPMGAGGTQGPWYADLIYPTPNVTINLTSPLSFNVIDSVTDNNNVILKTNKRCAATTLPNPKTIDLTQTSPAIATPHRFDSSNAASLLLDPCFVDTTATYPTGYTATFGFSVDNFPKDAVLNFDFTGTDRACNTAPRKKTTPNSVDIALLPPWLMTLGGDSYANSYTQMNLATHSSTGVGMTIVNNQLPTPANPSLNGRPAYLSTYNLMKATGFTSWNSRDSANAFALLSYTDQNGKPKADSGFTDWYSFLKDRVTQNFTDSVSTITPTAPYNNDTTHHITGVPVNGPTTNPDKINVVQVNGSMTLNNVTCDTKTIFFITGDLRIEPPFVISDTPAAATPIYNGCMFIVQGTTTIGKGSNLGIQTGHNTRYDQVFAMIITGDFVSEKDEPQTSPLPDGVNDGLELTGSVITANKLSTDQFLRNIGLVYNQYAPSEIFVYDGGRYIKLFGVLLSNPVEFSLQEKPFIDTLSK